MSTHNNMELLTPSELKIVTQFNDRAETSYVLAIKRLSHATDTNTAICAMILAVLDEIQATLAEAKIVHLSLGYDDAFARLQTLIFDLKNRPRVDQDLLNARHNLLFGLSEAHTKWVNNIFNEQESWFNEKIEEMEKVIHLYTDDISNNACVLDEAQVLRAEIWLAVSHSRMIHNYLGIR